MPSSTQRAPRPEGLAPVSVAELCALVGAANDGGDRGTTVISGVSLRHTDVRPGDLFAAVAGSAAHGASFVAAARQAGARAILTDRRGAEIVMGEAGRDGSLPVIEVPDPRAVVGLLASKVYANPSAAMTVIGVTGTSGKTTTCYLLDAALRAAGHRVGVIGTVASRIDGDVIPSTLTTPEAPDLQALLAVMRQRAVSVVAMEVSSHALVQGRVSGTSFAVGAFTNLSQDHLDFHGDMEHYFAAKKLLFDGRARHEVIVVDDDYGRRLATERPAATTVSTSCAQQADWHVRSKAADDGSQLLTITRPHGEPMTARLSLPGAFNVTNAVTALACIDQVDGDLDAAATGLATVTVPGRMERVDVGQHYLALVDYAHKPAALAALLAAARQHCDGRLILVVGAGGDRDRGKRPMMGEIAAAGADIVIVTDDNPRSEDPATIRQEILAGTSITSSTVTVREVAGRRAAITAAISDASAGDVVVVAGKGHEEGQEIAGVVHPFSDRVELAAAMTARRDAAGESEVTP